MILCHSRTQCTNKTISMVSQINDFLTTPSYARKTCLHVAVEGRVKNLSLHLLLSIIVRNKKKQFTWPCCHLFGVSLACPPLSQTSLKKNIMILNSFFSLMANRRCRQRQGDPDLSSRSSGGPFLGRTASAQTPSRKI